MYLVDIDDVEKYKPGLLKDSARFFRLYKIPQGKKENTIAFNNVPQNKVINSYLNLLLLTHLFLDYRTMLLNLSVKRMNTGMHWSMAQVLKTTSARE